MKLLEELSSFGFEETMVHVFEKLGYEAVELADVAADNGCDIIMIDNDGESAVIVECKHTDVVGRPAIQKLDSAVRTYEHDGHKRGMIATTGRLTDPATKYAQEADIEVIDGRRLSDIADEIGMDLYIGRIDVVCHQVLEAVHPKGPLTPIQETIADIGSLDWEDVPLPATTLTLVPTVAAVSHTERDFETDVGIVHHIDDTIIHVLDASRGGVQALPPDVQGFLSDNLDTAVALDLESLELVYDTVNKRRFGQSETEYRDIVVDRAIRQHSTTVSYTDDNNVSHLKECTPSRGDVSLEAFESVFVPRVYASIELGGQNYEIDWYGAGAGYTVTGETFHTCRVCETRMADATLDLAWLKGTVSKALRAADYTYCENCGRIVCQAHIRTEAVTEAPVCTACSVTDRFVGAKRYFFDVDHREAFTDEFQGRSHTERLQENIAGIVAIGFIIILAVLLLIG